MTKNEMFTKAHQMTKEIRTQYPEMNYRAQFGLCLKSLHEDQLNEQQAAVKPETINMLLNKKVVEINTFKREVAIKVESNKMFGVINKTRFIWDYTNNEIPKVEGTTGAEGVKAARYARLYILKRLELDNVYLPIKTKERTVEYMHLKEKDGVWINYFRNGYIRGVVDGAAFVWEPNKYQEAAVVNIAGLKGSITQIIDTKRIKVRLKEAGFTSVKMLMESFKDNSGELSA